MAGTRPIEEDSDRQDASCDGNQGEEFDTLQQPNPKRRRRQQLAVASAKAAKSKEQNRSDKNDGAGSDMAQHVMERQPGQQRGDKEGGGESNRDAIGDAHREEVHRGSKSHDGGKYEE